jgi:hypothetical protein
MRSSPDSVLEQAIFEPLVSVEKWRASGRRSGIWPIPLFRKWDQGLESGLLQR